MFDTGKTREDLTRRRKMAANKARLKEIDLETIRPLRAVLSYNTPNDLDIKKLSKLEQEAKQLRSELSLLGDSGV